MTFILGILQKAGQSEFQWRYPFLYREIRKMIIFEEVYYNNKKQQTKENNVFIDFNTNEDNIATNICVKYLCNYSNCCKRNNKLDKDQLFNDRIKKEIIKINDIPTENKWWYTYYFPCHTVKSTLSFIGCLLYLIWTINYLLLFSANINPEIESQILTSFGISQLTSIIITTPITLLLTLIFTWLFHKYIKKTNFETNIMPLHYHSDPFINTKSFGLTVNLTKSLFLKSIAESSINHPSDERIIAPVKGLVAQLISENKSKTNDLEYYKKIVKYNKISKLLNN
jgi:type III secretory pathway component EscR